MEDAGEGGGLGEGKGCRGRWRTSVRVEDAGEERGCRGRERMEAKVEDAG